MNTLSAPRNLLVTVALLLVSMLGCKKKEDLNPLLACRPPSTGTGIGIPNPRSLLFWIDHDFGCGALNFVSIRNTEDNSTNYGGSFNPAITRYSATQPACGTSGFITIQVSQGYEYEYTIACTGRQWQGKVTADCTSTDCIPIQLK